MAEEDKSVENLITEHIRGKKKEVCEVIDRLICEIGNPDRIAAAPLNQLSSVLGTLIDKFGAGEKDASAEGTLATLFNDFEEIG